jgi:F0F1-type ATP synthase membrane subunit b/b'
MKEVKRMDKFEKLVKEIMAEAEEDGGPVTREEAEEMARMELGAKENCKQYVQSEKPRKKAERVRKVDNEKGELLNQVKTLLEDLGAEVLNMKTETEVEFLYNSSHYTFKLTKHRPPKK